VDAAQDDVVPHAHAQSAYARDRADMKNNLALGLLCGFMVSLVGVLIWVFGPEVVPGSGSLGWFFGPATFVMGLTFLAVPDRRRFGVGLVLGSLLVAVMTVLFFVWLVSQIGS
jgi:Na+/proline symporter